MDAIICYTDYLPEGTERELSFMELLLDENWSRGRLEVPEGVFSHIGPKNQRLSVKQDYEFLLRAAREFPVKAVGGESPGSISGAEDAWESYRTDCYILGKYQQELLEGGYFNPVVETLLSNIAQLPQPETAVAWMEKMISRGPEYYGIDDNTAPVLVYLGDNTCFSTLHQFALELAEAFRCLRQRVEVFDVAKEGNQALTQLIGRRFKAVIGIQSYVFGILMQDGKTNLHDLIIGPKYNMVLDHPAWLKEHIAQGPKDYSLLIHDRNYIDFARRYYPNLKDVIYFPPGASTACRHGANDQGNGSCLPVGCPAAGNFHYQASIEASQSGSHPDKLYDITFVGSYRDYRERLSIIRTYDRRHRHFAARYIGAMKRHPDYPAEKAFGDILSHYGMKPDTEGFLQLFYEMRQCCFCIMLYYREKVIRTLLEAGIELHVYSESWKNSPFWGHKNLICHPELPAAESLQAMQQSRISLNIMSWHKDGLTERILNAMLCQSVMVSDRSTALEELFEDGRDLVLFSLEHLEKLPMLLKDLLGDEKRLKEISWNGRQKVRQGQLWRHRAEMLLENWNDIGSD